MTTTTTKAFGYRKASPPKFPGTVGSPCPRCGEALGNLTYRTTISGGARIVHLADVHRPSGSMHYECADARRDELNEKERAR